MNIYFSLMKINELKILQTFKIGEITNFTSKRQDKAVISKQGHHVAYGALFKRSRIPRYSNSLN